jgi:flavin reductase (DIM6/NTAB) family NADH-FMN oxidoreductase RutF
MFYDTARRDHGMTQDPLTALIVPRPIGWISTLDGQGRVNLAPYSFYNAVSASPPMVYFSTTGTYGDNPTKHSRRNAEETGEFVVNMVSAVLAKQMNITTSMVDYGVDEMKLAGLTPAPSRYVKPPRVAESPIALECKYWKTIEMPIEKVARSSRRRWCSAVSSASTSTTASSRTVASTRSPSSRSRGSATANTPRPRTSGACRDRTIRGISRRRPIPPPSYGGG